MHVLHPAQLPGCNVDVANQAECDQCMEFRAMNHPMNVDHSCEVAGFGAMVRRRVPNLLVDFSTQELWQCVHCAGEGRVCDADRQLSVKCATCTTLGRDCTVQGSPSLGPRLFSDAGHRGYRIMCRARGLVLLMVEDPRPTGLAPQLGSLLTNATIQLEFKDYFNLTLPYPDLLPRLDANGQIIPGIPAAPATLRASWARKGRKRVQGRLPDGNPQPGRGRPGAGGAPAKPARSSDSTASTGCGPTTRPPLSALRDPIGSSSSNLPPRPGARRGGGS
ncbi:unnamed protein product [Parascedosporium putredinis]|uniref:Uncharacterized protein n=1 Tax=Parascedosporium putredinis TaxID=1442378 RepID=A0A9P1H511_9PEZI|nr:unnamed protein product [Parascedosporium putredinis]CAI7996449.1 unnamed protein product [Parascedosporium putredinis]